VPKLRQFNSASSTAAQSTFCCSAWHIFSLASEPRHCLFRLDISLPYLDNQALSLLDIQRHRFQRKPPYSNGCDNVILIAVDHDVPNRNFLPAGAADYLDRSEEYARKSKADALHEVNSQPNCLGDSGFRSVPCLRPWSFGRCPNLDS
jgi:hypothetical protein